MRIPVLTILLNVFSFTYGSKVYEANPDTKRLYDDLLSNYNRLIRPVINNTETLTVWLGLKLSQLIEMNLKNQVMTTNVWVEQKWFDYKLQWDPQEYGGVEMLYVPSENIWLPDIVLYNKYKTVDLKHMKQEPGSNLVAIGIDLTDFYLSVEWDILEVPAARNEEYYPCCEEPYSDITFNITMRRKTLFYTVNLIIPCVGITFLTVLVFYLPSDSGEKVSLCSSILLSLTVFFLLLAEIIPPTSLAIPLLGKYLLSPSTHNMSPWVRQVFLNWMPRVLMMRRTPYSTPEYDDTYMNSAYINEIDYSVSGYPLELKGSPDAFESVTSTYKITDSENTIPRLSPDVISALKGVRFIAQHIKDADKDNEVIEDWKFVAMVLDRFFLWVFTFACIGGTLGIIFQAPSLYDTRVPVDQRLSGISLRNYMYPPPNGTFDEE
ncbi:hypothetical protein DMN91_008243 [Ooceraea biroi]|uniref:Acetylcholine receptor subunit beta-like protein n=1 Tax=Ooceraea biroi TaxID=2015173 RepID=A0A3L8DH91_OOCBI|nr:hypothetical protein DMN91_008243 [Ooceraea biroi]